MRIITAIAVAATVATPVATLQIVDVLGSTSSFAELSIQDRENKGKPYAASSSDGSFEVAGAKKNKRERKTKTKNPSPLVDTVRDTQIG